MPDTRLAVDTNFLLDLACRRDEALDALEVIRRRLRGARIFVTPTAFKELVNIAVNHPALKQRDDAHKALAGMRAWGMLPVELTDLQATFARSIATKLLDQGVIPLEERNDALIFAEAAMLECQLLVSSDSHLRDADRTRLALALQACGAPVVVVCRPDEIVRMFAGRR